MVAPTTAAGARLAVVGPAMRRAAAPPRHPEASRGQ